MTPAQVVSSAPDGRTHLVLPVTGPFEHSPAFGLLTAHAVPGVEQVDADARTVRRLLELDGRLVDTTVTVDPDAVRAEFASADPAVAALAEPVLRHWFDLDADTAARVAAFADDPLLGPLVSARPGIRIVGHADGAECAITTVLGQQVSLAAARTFAGRLAAAFGEPGPGGLVRFPAADRIAAVPHDELRAAVGITNARARTVHAVVAAIADGLVLRPGVDLAATRRALLALPGVGPWTADYLAIRALGDPDAFPGGDLVLRRALGVSSARDAERLAEPWRPHRALAVFHLWAAAVGW